MLIAWLPGQLALQLSAFHLNELQAKYEHHLAELELERGVPGRAVGRRGAAR